MNFFKNLTAIIFWALVSWIVVRIFFMQIAMVPTASMNNTIMEHDRIIINKLAYGARLPITPLSLPGGNIYIEWLRLPYFRLPGYSKVCYNDVVVFNLPEQTDVPVDQRKEYVKRCIALPGDTLRIIAGYIYINGQRIVSDRYQKHVSDSLYYHPSFFPNSSQIKWNLDFFGPLYIPRKGDSISINRTNLILYEKLIKFAEGNDIKIRNDSVYVNGGYINKYCFKMNYYFMLGDNRDNSIDSRYWGLLPEDHIIGKVSAILFPLSAPEGKKLNENYFFKSIK